MVVHGRIESLLPKLISPNQVDFVKKRCLIENVLLTQKVIIYIRKRAKPVNIIIKLNMMKAYDRISWLYLTLC